MRMLFILLIAFLSLSACQDEMETNLPVVPKLLVSQDTLLLGRGTSNTKIAVITNSEYWEAEVPEEISWCSFSMNNAPGANYLMIKVTQNPDAAVRSTFVTVMGDNDLEKKILVQQMGSAPVILTSPESFSGLIDDTITVQMSIKANMAFRIEIPDTVNWIHSVGRKDKDTTVYTFGISPNGLEERDGVIVLQANDSTFRKIIKVNQLGRNLDYKPGNDSEIEGAVKLKVTGGLASEAQGGSEIGKSYDGDFNTNYHSPYSGAVSTAKYPVTLEYDLDESADIIDFIQYIPRASGSNGNFKKGKIYYKNVDNPKYTFLCDFDFEGKTSSSRIALPGGIKFPRGFKFEVDTGVGGFVSCAEMEFLCKPQLDADLDAIFTDHSYSELKPDVTYDQIAALDDKFYANIAKYLYNKEYPMFRILSCEPYQKPSTIQREFKISPYSELDNPTGIYVEAGENTLVFVGDTHGEEVSLRVMDYTLGYKTTGNYPLIEGINNLTMRGKGLVYVMYHTDNYQSAEPIKVHIATGGKNNGYFDRRIHTASDWTKILQRAVTEHIDVLGNKVHLLFPVKSFVQYTRGNIFPLLDFWEGIVADEHRLMGLETYNRSLKNRMFCHVVYKSNEPTAYMYATNFRTAYVEDQVPFLLDLSKISTNEDKLWGVSHEMGHVHQTRPGLKWIGLTEVTNNLHSLNVQKLRGFETRLARGNNYEGAFTSLLIARIPHAAEGNVFRRLVPFWQMKLCSDAMGKILYEDMHEQIRNSPDLPTNGECQLNYVKMCCDILELDMTDYFRAWGFLKEVDMIIEDYATEQLKCTPAQIAEVEAYIADKGYPKASEGLIYITDQSMLLFKNKPQDMEAGTAVKSGVKYTVSDSRNVVAYEVYSDGKLIMASPNKTFSTPPASGITIQAVGWNGIRKTVTLK